ncbi:hypothetical protein TNCV_3878891 [Trichonephila clavipes]|nr:hypothetical protein TNCV_3878891 [Trichonephila clavipes]
MTEEDVDLMRQIKLEVDSDDVQQLLDSHDQELTIVLLIDMYEQKQDIEKLLTQFNHMIPVYLAEGLNLIEKGFQIVEDTYSNEESVDD